MPLSSGWSNAVATFGAETKAKLAGPGDREAAIRAPLDGLLTALGGLLGLVVVPFDEVRDTERGVRPDYAISVGGAITGYIEVKAPGRSIFPADFTGHDLVQWERQRDLPNLIYTNGNEWRLWRDGEAVGDPVRLDGNVATSGSGLAAPDAFESTVTDFLRWRPAPITSVGALVRAVAPLTRLLRGEVLDQLKVEQAARDADGDAAITPFSDLAHDWRQLLFPTATDETFADGYAQAVTFALLLARSENVEIEGQSLHEVGRSLGSNHSLIGKALQVLTNDVEADFRISLDLLVRVVAAVRWDRVRRDAQTYLHLYEDFLEVYDSDLRKQSGTYYTPRPVVSQMVRLTEDLLSSRLNKETKFLDPSVVTVDPAMGTGTFLHAIIERAAMQVDAADGPGAVPGAIDDLAKRLIGFELQMGSFAVAELRTTDLIRSMGSTVPTGGLKLFVTDTLDDPNASVTNLGAGLELIARSRRAANDVKANQHVTVVIGNPPYRERAEGLGGWVESGDSVNNIAAPLDSFRTPGGGRLEHNLKNLYVYFWRWATLKVFDDFPEAGGIVTFITTNGYMRGPGFAGMRKYLRERASEGWIINVSPEGMRPPVGTRIFPGVQRPLSIGVFVRAPGTSNETPATIRYTELSGRRAEKYQALADLHLDGAEWREARTDWMAPFTPAALTDWDDFVALYDLFPWSSPGVTGNRRWPMGTTAEVLRDRWSTLISARTTDEKATLLKATSDRHLASEPSPLAGSDTSDSTTQLLHERGPSPEPIRYGYRTMDRHWIIPDNRVLDRPRPDLWRARIPGQVFVVEHHARALASGPAVVFTSLVPDLDHFITPAGGGGRVLPLLHPNGDGTPPAALLAALSAAIGRTITASDLLAYVAAVTAHDAYTRQFADELRTPGVRVPITTDAQVWVDAVAVGREVIWAQTYGEAFADATEGRTPNSVRFAPASGKQVRALTAVTGLPDTLTYDESSETVSMGDGSWGPVPREVVDYEIGMRNVLENWFNYRRASSTNRETSPLDEIMPTTWSPGWTNEFTDLLSAVRRLVELQPQQATILERVLAGPMLGVEALAAAGYAGAEDPDRRPRSQQENTLDIDI